MSIGTTVKLGFDASAVRKGFALLPKMFAGSMKGLKWAGVGAAAKVGAGVTDLLGKAVMAVPNGIRDMMDYAGTLNDVSTQTKIAIKDLMVLEEAMRLSGAEGDIPRMIATFAKNLRSAMTEEGGPNDAIRRLGFSPDEFKGLKVDEAFRKIGMRAKDFRGEVGELDEIMSDLFGGRMGYKLIRFFDDFSGNMEQAEKNVGQWGEQMQEKAQGIDDAGDALGRYRKRWLQLMEVLSGGIGIGTGGDPINAMFDWLNPERVRSFANAIKQTFTYLRESAAGFFKEGGFSTLFDGIGKQIGESIKNAIGGALKDAFSLQSLMPNWLGGIPSMKQFTFPPAPEQDKSLSMIDKTLQRSLQEQQRQSRSLYKMEGGVSAVAV